MNRTTIPARRVIAGIVASVVIVATPATLAHVRDARSMDNAPKVAAPMP